jgi:DNA (cytosine-5)-methyltransferase 1
MGAPAIREEGRDIRLLYIDLFCGIGGVSAGISLARRGVSRCAKVIAAVDKSAAAIATYKANHGDNDTKVWEADVTTLDLTPLWLHVVAMRNKYPQAKVVLWASVECQSFSCGRGSKPCDAESRSLAYALRRYVDTLFPEYIYVENVPEFRNWGPLGDDGIPVSAMRGVSFEHWRQSMECSGGGYKSDCRILNAADYGAYTSRRRCFVIFALHGLPIEWPALTHSRHPGRDLFRELEGWKPVREVLDLNDRGESIFTRRPPLCDNTLDRIYAGLQKFGRTANGDFSFIQQNYCGDPNDHIASIETPSRTITCSKDNQQLVSVQFLSCTYSTGDNNHSLDNPCPSVGTVRRMTKINVSYGLKCEYSLLPLGDSLERILTFMKEHIITDIHMRSLTTPELRKIMGFPNSYVLPEKTGEAVHGIGNAVEVNQSTALCEALADRLWKIEQQGK